MSQLLFFYAVGSLKHIIVAFVVVSELEEQKPEQICAHLKVQETFLELCLCCVGQMVFTARSNRRDLLQENTLIFIILIIFVI